MYITCSVIWHRSKKSIFKLLGNEWHELCPRSEHEAAEIQVSASIGTEDYFF